jgi:hypothetical protein
VSRIGDALALVLLCNNDHHRITRKRTSDFAPIYFQSGVLTIVACTPATLLMIVNDWSVYTPLSDNLVAVALGIAAWVLGLWLLRHALLIEAGNIGVKNTGQPSGHRPCPAGFGRYRGCAETARGRREAHRLDTNLRHSPTGAQELPHRRIVFTTRPLALWRPGD